MKMRKLFYKKKEAMRIDRLDTAAQGEEGVDSIAIEWIAPHRLVSHPRQIAIYGEDEVADLVEAIRTSGWIKPLVITQQDVIISGHRRFKAALLLKWRTIPVERRMFANATEEVEALLLENRYREKTPVQRVREAFAWKDIEGEKARQRMSEAARAQRQGCENFHTPERGRVADQVAERVGFGSGRTYEKAAKVVQVADRLSSQGREREAQTLLTVLNDHSVDAAAQVLKLAEEEQCAVLQKLATGEQKKVKAAVVEVKKAAIEAQIQAEPGKPRLTLARWEEWLPDQPLCDLLLTDPPYSTDIEDIDAFAHSWLPLALSKVKPTGRAYVCIGAYPRELLAYLQVRAWLPVSQVLVWSYRNTLGPSPSTGYKQNWQAILSFCGPEASALDCPLLTEQFSVQEINAPDGRLGNRYHTWQKPDELAERLIRHSTRPGDVVLDCFAGTGTFLLAAHRLGRTALGCEQSSDMLMLAQRRGCEMITNNSNNHCSECA